MNYHHALSTRDTDRMFWSHSRTGLFPEQKTLTRQAWEIERVNREKIERSNNKFYFRKVEKGVTGVTNISLFLTQGFIYRNYYYY